MMTTTKQLGQLDAEIARIAAELDTFPFVPKHWNWIDGEAGLANWGNAAGGRAVVTAGCGGAAVYHDIIAEGASGTRAKIQDICDMLVLGFEPTRKADIKAALAVVNVALARIAGEAVSKPALPADAGLYYTPRRSSAFFAGRATAPVVVAPKPSAAALGAKVRKYLRQDARKPFGARGVNIIIETARAAWRAAEAEMAAL